MYVRPCFQIDRSKDLTEEMMKKQENFWDKLGDLLFAPVDIMFWIKKVWAAYPVCRLPVIVLKVNVFPNTGYTYNCFR